VPKATTLLTLHVESLRGHCTITGVRNVTQVRFKPDQKTATEGAEVTRSVYK